MDMNQPIRAGHYRNLTTNTVSYYCNCSAQPAHLTLRAITANRANYEPFPAPKKPGALS